MLILALDFKMDSKNLILLPPSVIKSSTNRTFSFAFIIPSICEFLPNFFFFSYVRKWKFIFCAINDAKGIPADSPPAIFFIF